MTSVRGVGKNWRPTIGGRDSKPTVWDHVARVADRCGGEKGSGLSVSDADVFSGRSLSVCWLFRKKRSPVHDTGPWIGVRPFHVYRHAQYAKDSGTWRTHLSFSIMIFRRAAGHELSISGAKPPSRDARLSSPPRLSLAHHSPARTRDYFTSPALHCWGKI